MLVIIAISWEVICDRNKFSNNANIFPIATTFISSSERMKEERKKKRKKKNNSNNDLRDQFANRWKKNENLIMWHSIDMNAFEYILWREIPHPIGSHSAVIVVVVVIICRTMTMDKSGQQKPYQIHTNSYFLYLTPPPSIHSSLLLFLSLPVSFSCTLVQNRLHCLWKRQHEERKAKKKQQQIPAIPNFISCGKFLSHSLYLTLRLSGACAC